jgi:hypothetical protein
MKGDHAMRACQEDKQTRKGEKKKELADNYDDK